MSNDHVLTPKFDGTTKYDTWRYQFMRLLEYKKCKEVVDNENNPDSTKEEDWKCIDVKAKFFLRLTVNPDEIVDCSSAFGSKW